MSFIAALTQVETAKQTNVAQLTNVPKFIRFHRQYFIRGMSLQQPSSND